MSKATFSHKNTTVSHAKNVMVAKSKGDLSIKQVMCSPIIREASFKISAYTPDSGCIGFKDTPRTAVTAASNIKPVHQYAQHLSAECARFAQHKRTVATPARTGQSCRQHDDRRSASRCHAQMTACNPWRGMMSSLEWHDVIFWLDMMSSLA